MSERIAAPYDFDQRLSLMQGEPLAWIDRDGVVRVEVFGGRLADRIPLHRTRATLAAVEETVRALLSGARRDSDRR